MTVSTRAYARGIVLALGLLQALPAAAQTASLPPLVEGKPETVYSDAQREKDEALSRRFVQSILRPSHSLEGQFTRWKKPICPHVIGMTPSAAFVVERRIRDVANQVGAPVNRKDPCLPNIEIFFTPEPQATLDDIRHKDFLLVAATPFAGLSLTQRYPVQSYYYGFYRDYKGAVWLDMDWEFYLDDPPHVASNMTRLRTGIKAEMGMATIVIDAGAVAGQTLASLGDYLALMALAQTPATGRCQPAPSISNLFLKDCDGDLHTTVLSEADRAMLTALYATPEEPEKLQWQRVGGYMQKALEKQATGK
jgi:hypothetical protein